MRLCCGLQQKLSSFQISEDIISFDQSNKKNLNVYCTYIAIFVDTSLDRLNFLRCGFGKFGVGELLPQADPTLKKSRNKIVAQMNMVIQRSDTDTMAGSHSAKCIAYQCRCESSHIEVPVQPITARLGVPARS